MVAMECTPDRDLLLIQIPVAKMKRSVHLSMGKWTRGCASKNKAVITLVSCEIWRDVSLAFGS